MKSGPARPELHHIPTTGLTVVIDVNQPALDIVFIHGFTGSPIGTWATHQINRDDSESAERTSILQKLNVGSWFKSHHEDSKSGRVKFYWPQELLPEVIPNARVLTYGYDTKIRHRTGRPVSTHGVYDIAWDFLVALEAERRDEPQRPVIFIAHSLGGIVVKEMLLRSSTCSLAQTHLKTIFQSTRGIVFFGTPHAGADFRGLLTRIAIKLFRAAGFRANERIVNSLLPSAERLRELRDSFTLIAKDQNWIIHSFIEQYPLNRIGQKVVEDSSSSLNIPEIEITESIGRDHMRMIKFTGEDDPEFKKVAAALERIVSGASKRVCQDTKSSLSASRKKALMKSLEFSQMDSRWLNIKKAHPETCTWMLQQPQYIAWLDDDRLDKHRGFLWLKGKPGAGKSTSMKFLLEHMRNQHDAKTVVSFFFHARGVDLEKSTNGMYRTLVLQLFEQVPSLQHTFEAVSFLLRGELSLEWSDELLKVLFEQAVQCMENESVVCFIDALDECDEGQIRDMVCFFEHIGNLAVLGKRKFRACFSSRHYPHITMKYGLTMRLEGQEGHGQDIIKYVDSKISIGESETAEKIKADLPKKASGVFMWAVVVVQLLNEEFDRGNIHALEQRLQDLPEDLHSLFQDIMTRDQRREKELLLCIQWVLFATQPLSPQQLYYAIRSGVHPEALQKQVLSEVSLDDVRRFILSCSKGLTEITDSQSPVVQFIHESVRDFLLKDKALYQVWPELSESLEGKSHDRLKQCCLAHILRVSLAGHPVCNPPSMRTDRVTMGPMDCLVTHHDFTRYAVGEILRHADTARKTGIRQREFLENFPLARWISLYNNLLGPIRPDASMLYILAKDDRSHLVKDYPSIMSCVEEERESPHDCPYLVALGALAYGTTEVFRRELRMHLPPGHRLRLDGATESNWEAELDLRATAHSPYNTPLICRAAQFEDEVLFAYLFENMNHSLNTQDEEGYTPLIWAVERENKEMVKLIATSGRADLDLRNKRGETAFSWAMLLGDLDTARLLVENGTVDIDSKDKLGYTPLLRAAMRGNVQLAEQLMKTGRVDVDVRDRAGATPLAYAAECDARMVKLFLETGNVDLNSRDVFGSTPLSRAIHDDGLESVKMFLATGQVDVNSKDRDGVTPIDKAVDLVPHNPTTLGLLLRVSDAIADVKDTDGMTPLSRAARNGYENIVRTLLNSGKADPDSKDNQGRTPLSLATQFFPPNIGIPKLLLDTGQVDPDSEDHYKRTPLSRAASAGGVHVVKLLLDTGKVAADSKDATGRTPISWASESSQKGCREVILALLETGQVDVNSTDMSGRTPLSWAAGSYGRHAKLVMKTLLNGNADLHKRDNDGHRPKWWYVRKRQDYIDAESLLMLGEED